MRPLRENTTKTKLRDGRAVFGVIAKSSDPLVAELIGLAGFDFYMIDGEHGLINPEQVTHIVRACEAVGITPLARIGQNDPKLILAHLDAGVQGIMLPGVETVAEMRRFVAACRYPPDGMRGLGLARSADYLIDTDADAYVAHANANVLIMPQFEDVALLDRLPELAAVPGIDGFVIGPRDLALTMGYPDGPNHPDVQTVIDAAIDHMHAAGVWAGITAGTAPAATAQRQRGARLLLNALPALIVESGRRFLEAR